MRAYIIRRMLIAIPTLLLGSILIFAIVYMIPGDFADLIQSSSIEQEIDVDLIRRDYGLDVSPVVQYLR